MNSMERLRVLSHLIILLKTFAAGTRTINNQQWVEKVDRVFEDDDSDGASAVADEASPPGIYELLAVKPPAGAALAFLGTVLSGCNLISLDGVCLLAEIPEASSDHVVRRSLDSGNFWRIKCPYRGVELFLDCHDAAAYCRPYCHSPTAQRIIRWLDQQPPHPPDDRAGRHRLRILDAVDSSQYIVTLLGAHSSAGHVVLIRASDGHVHVASFLKACVGLPVSEMELWDDRCVPLEDLRSGPVGLRLDEAQMDLLCIPASARPPISPLG